MPLPGSAAGLHAVTGGRSSQLPEGSDRKRCKSRSCLPVLFQSLLLLLCGTGAARSARKPLAAGGEDGAYL